MYAFGNTSRCRLVLALAAATLLAGCASMGASHASRDGVYKRDAAYVNAVENIALRRGVRVVWVNPPPDSGRRSVPIR
jgi:hypothetical protein